MLIYLGYAGVWGSLLRQSWQETKWLGIIFGIFLFLPASLGLPWAITYKLPAWGLAILTIVVFMKRPTILPGMVMATLIFVWIFWDSDDFRAHMDNHHWRIEFWFWLGLPAMLAGVSGLFKIKYRGNQPGVV